jgi:hypothetical protein
VSVAVSVAVAMAVAVAVELSWGAKKNDLPAGL